ncbi:MAG: S-adenosylmethionine:tRNA ribosyltransferase-isomerase, partial [Eubacteriales bacterium]
MKTSDFSYDLPEELIAQTPIFPRDASRMLVCNREDEKREGRIFRDLPDYLRPEDVVVINHTRVIPARLLGIKEETGAAVEFLLLRRLGTNTWESLVKPGRRLPRGARVSFGDGLLKATVGDTMSGGTREVTFSYDGLFENVLERLGEMPLPPYIHERLSDPSRYQTVYARYDGSAAAPTAGLHFTPEVLERIREKGVDIVPILLHVGLGTFRPVKAQDLDEHDMHSEYYEVS